MTRLFEDQQFERFFDRDSGVVFSDIEFRRCRFLNCDISITFEPELRSTVRNVKLFDCEYVEVAGLSCAILEDVFVEGLKTRGLLQTWAAVFKHVVLRGKIGNIMISNQRLATANVPLSTLRAFAEANAAYYATVDWALDISQAEFVGCDIRGVPAKLIRRDPETQVVVTHQKAMQGHWRELDLRKTFWREFIQGMLEDGEQDVVLVAPKRARNFKQLLDGLNLLREAGVAEPD